MALPEVSKLNVEVAEALRDARKSAQKALAGDPKLTRNGDGVHRYAGPWRDNGIRERYRIMLLYEQALKDAIAVAASHVSRILCGDYDDPEDGIDIEALMGEQQEQEEELRDVLGHQEAFFVLQRDEGGLGGEVAKFDAGAGVCLAMVRERARVALREDPKVMEDGADRFRYYPAGQWDEEGLHGRMRLLVEFGKALQIAIDTAGQHAARSGPAGGRLLADGYNEVLAKEDAEAQRLLLVERDAHQAELDDLMAETRKHQEAFWLVQRDHLGLSNGWVGSWELGSGAYGSAHKWVKVDSTNIIVDRVVIKDARSNGNGSDWWNRLDTYWGRDPRDATGKQFLPNEVLAMYRLRSRIGSDSIVHVRNHRLFPREERLLMYLEYAPFGDLSQFVQWYQKQLEALWLTLDILSDWQKERPDRDKANQRPWLPEAFLWSVFESLAHASLLMATGDIHPSPVSDWTPIYHLDMKLANIFLGVPLKSRYRGYPSTKVGDFGLCWLPKTQTGGLPLEQKWRGSAWNGPPEGFKVQQGSGRAEQEVCPSTNVWGVGIVMYGLVELEEGDRRLDWEWRPEEDVNTDRQRRAQRHHQVERLDVPTFRPGAKKHYSSTLLKLITDCLQYRPRNRPTPQALLDRVGRNLVSGQGARVVRDIRPLPADDAAFESGPHVVWSHLSPSQDKHALWSRLPASPYPEGRIDQRVRKGDGFYWPPTIPPLPKNDVPDRPVVGGGPWAGLAPVIRKSKAVTVQDPETSTGTEAIPAPAVPVEEEDLYEVSSRGQAAMAAAGKKAKKTAAKRLANGTQAKAAEDAAREAEQQSARLPTQEGTQREDEPTIAASQAPAMKGRDQPRPATHKPTTSGPGAWKQNAQGPKVTEKRRADNSVGNLADEAGHAPEGIENRDEEVGEPNEQADNGVSRNSGGRMKKTALPKKGVATKKRRAPTADTRAGDPSGGKKSTRKRRRDDEDDDDDDGGAGPGRSGLRALKRVDYTR
ncbi:trifunctional histidinol dehydrogenase [Recurvomyces mirabilis]|nr:trifunctional histidinol dehydrogenase [Recurvomyces mirabilis]